jgi:hypothetical protein
MSAAITTGQRRLTSGYFQMLYLELSPPMPSNASVRPTKESDANRSRDHLETFAGRPGDVEITRRRMLGVTGGLAILTLAGSASATLTVPTKWSSETMEIMRSGSRPSGKGPTEYFTGSVRIDPLFQAPDPARGRGASVTFEPGARTAWHTHPLGQTLIVTAGCGWVQREG